MRKQRKAIIVAIILYLILLVLDVVSTLMNGNLVKYLEANLMYQYVGIFGIVIVNMLILAVVYWLYQRSSNDGNRYVYINMMVTIVVLRVLVIWNNIQVYLHPPTIQQAQQVTAAAKQAAVAQIVWLGFIPFIIGIVAFIIWKLDHKVEIKEVENGTEDNN